MLILALILTSFSHAAESSFTCSATAANGEALVARFSLSLGGPSSELRVNGVEAEGLTRCQRLILSDLGASADWRCPHELNGIRYELYPVMPRGQYEPELRLIRWANDEPELIYAN